MYHLNIKDDIFRCHLTIFRCYLIIFVILFQVKRGGNKNITPYILFASEIRKLVTDENKGASFGEISKLVGDKVIF